MSWIDKGRRHLRRVFQFRSMRPDLDLEVDAEIDYHLARTRDEIARGGASKRAARREARRRFGDVERHRSELLVIHRQRGRRERVLALFGSTVGSVRQATRSLRATPTVTLTVVATAALGIGANATMFGIVDRLLLRAPDHVVEPDRVVRLYIERNFAGRPIVGPSTSYLDVMDWNNAEGFAAVAAVSNLFGDGNMTLGHGAGARKLMGQNVTAGFFPLLGVQPFLGRFFTESEDIVGRADVVVLGYDFWRRHFHERVDVLGESIVLDGVPHDIIGVAPRGFTGVELERIDLWAPLRASAGPVDPAHFEQSRGYHWLRGIARLAPGATAAAVESEATALHRAGRAEQASYDPQARVRLGALVAARGVSPSDESRVAGWLGAVSVIVLLIACANVANILLARATRQRREIGIRMALGVSRRRLLVQLLLESTLLAALGGVAALAVAAWGTQMVRAVLLPNVHWADSTLSLRVLGFTTAASLLTGLLAGLGPGLASTRAQVVAVLGGAGRPHGVGAAGSRFRTGMLALQVTLSVILLVGAGLFVRSLTAIRAVDLGFDPEGVLLAAPEFDEAALPRDQRGEYFRTVAPRVAGLDAVRGVTAAATIPFYSSVGIPLSVPDVPEPPRFPTGGPYLLTIDPDYFATMGIRILRGRGFGEQDSADAPRVVVVEQAMADAYWPDGNALGKCIKLGGDEAPCSTVVGVSESTARQSLVPQQEAQYYVPLAQRRGPPFALFVRVDPGSADEAAAAIRGVLESASAAVRYANVQPLRNLIDPQARSWELGASMFAIFGLVALTIASVGLYGNLSFAVAQRTREIGVRSALGAGPRSIVRLVAGHAVKVCAASLAIGVAIATAAGRWIEPLLFRVDATDPVVIGAVVSSLLAVTALASTIPARRAIRIDPVEALRVD